MLGRTKKIAELHHHAGGAMERLWLLLVVLCAASITACESVAVAPTSTLSAQELLTSPQQQSGYDPRKHIVLTHVDNYRWVGEAYGSQHLRDVMRHTEPDAHWFHQDAELPTIAHETHHAIQVAHTSHVGALARFFYFEQGFGAYVTNPRSSLRLLNNDGDAPVYTKVAYTKTADIRARLPKSACDIARLRDEAYLLAPGRERYGVMILFNEWNAYVAEARIAVELWNARQYYKESQPGFPRTSGMRRIGELDGMVDFLYFVSAGIVALMDKEPDYMRENEQLRAVYALLAEQTMLWHKRGRRIPLFAGFHSEKLLHHFVHSPDNQRNRTVLRDWLGSDWTMRTFGF